MKNGQTNAVYVKLVAKYYINGYSEEQAHERFVNHVKNSPRYTGPLLNNLKSRINTSYAQMAAINLSQMKSLSTLYSEHHVRSTIDALIIRMCLNNTSKSRMRNSMIKFLLNIISWKLACDKIFNNRETAFYWNYLYPLSWMRYKEGYYPLPYSLLRKWNVHYDRPLRLLKDFGILEESIYHYSTSLKRCKYYKINIPYYFNKASTWNLARGKRIAQYGVLNHEGIKGDRYLKYIFIILYFLFMYLIWMGN